MEESDPFRDDSFSYKTRVPCISRFRRLIRTADMYALPITLRYKEEKKFFTNFGAATSIMVFLSMLMLSMYGIMGMIANEEIK